MIQTFRGRPVVMVDDPIRFGAMPIFGSGLLPKIPLDVAVEERDGETMIVAKPRGDQVDPPSQREPQ